MNIIQFPDHVLLKIFRSLPARDFIRIGRVSEQFRKISKEAMSRMESIDLNDEIFRKITGQQLASLFEKCWNLEKIKFRPCRPDFIAIFDQFYFSNLVELDLSDNGVGLYQFWNFIRQNRNIEILKCPSCLCGVNFPDDVISEKLAALEIQQVDVNFFESATGRCPNLRSLAISELPCNDPRNTRLASILNDFFASCLMLTKFSTKDASINSTLMRVDSFRRLNFREISVSVGSDFDETMFGKFISSFPDLEVVSFNDGSVTPEIISKLARFPKLRSLSVQQLFQDIGTDQSVNLFVGSEVLQHLEIRGAIVSPTTLKGFIRHCPRLSFLRVRGIEGIETAQDAANFIRSLNEFSATSRSCHLVIRFEKVPYAMWESKKVKDALKGVNEKLMFEFEESE